MPGGIAKALKQALDFQEAVDYKRRGRSTLTNPKRRGIFEYLCSHPCISTAEICRRVGLSQSSARWHLDKLMEEGYVANQRLSKRRVYYPRGLIDGSDTALLQTLSLEKHKKAYLHILSNGGSTQREAAQCLGLSRQSLIRIAERLENLNLITTVQDGKFKRYYPTTLLSEKREKNHTRIKVFQKEFISKLEEEGISKEVLRKTGEEMVIALHVGPRREILRIRTDPFVALFC